MYDWSYTRCPNCPGDHRQVFPEGPVDAEVMVIGEGPGFWEDRTGFPFCGPAGEELDNTYLRLAGLRRSAVFVTNIVQCRCEKNGNDVRPGAALASACAANHLREEIWTVNPKIIILCGATALALVPDMKLELEHGFPCWVTNCPGLFGWSGWLVAMYHPAAGLHETRYMTPLLEDWERLGHWLNHTWQAPSETEHSVDYSLIETANDFTAYTDSPNAYVMNALDTENDEDAPWSLQFSHTSGTARMILSANREMVRLFSEWAADCGADWYMHFMVHDLNVLDRMEIDLSGLYSPAVGGARVYDTMQELYHLGNLPQGLKAAVYRTLGYRMTSYDEVVVPHSQRVLQEWLAEAYGYVVGQWPSYTEHPVGKGCPVCGKNHRKVIVDRKSHPAEAVLRRVLHKLAEESTTYDAWQKPKWEKGNLKPRLIGRPWLADLERSIRRMPRKSIVHVPLNEAVNYGCSDADNTGKLARWLTVERERITQEEWRVM